jgi:microcystin-dependent protein
MSTPFVGEIRMFAGNFAPAGWAFCDGSLLPVSGNDALFSLIGTTYGGDGRTTFGLPDLRGRVPIHAGTGAGLAPVPLAALGGVEQVTLTVNQIPSHGHGLTGSSQNADQAGPGNNLPARSLNVDLYSGDPPNVSAAAGAVGAVGGSQAHDNMQPYLCVNFIIALFGIYPPRN